MHPILNGVIGIFVIIACAPLEISYYRGMSLKIISCYLRPV